MKSEHRHELKTNELADWIAHIPDFLRRNIRTIIGAALITAAVVVYISGRTMRQGSDLTRQIQATSLIEQVEQNKIRILQGQMQNEDMPNLLLIMANRLQIAANESKNPQLAALALIKRAQALRADLHYRASDVEMDIIKSQIGQARKAYKQAIEKADGNNTLTAMATFGLGLCAEEVRNYDKAVEFYRQIVTNPDFEATGLQVQAKLRLDTMADNKDRFVFVKAAEIPEIPEIFEPVIEPLSVEPAEPLPPSTAPAEPAVEPQTPEPETK